MVNSDTTSSSRFHIEGTRMTLNPNDMSEVIQDQVHTEGVGCEKTTKHAHSEAGVALSKNFRIISHYIPSHLL